MSMRARPTNPSNSTAPYGLGRRHARLKKRFLRTMFMGVLGASFAMTAVHANASSSTLQIDPRDGANGFKIPGSATDHLGVSVSGTGDVNGDGFDDFLVGAPYTTVAGKGSVGSVYVVFGNGGPAPAEFNPATLNGTNGFRIDGDAEAHYLGYAVGRAGDINGDGFDDILVGSPYNGVHGLFTGAAYVIFGKDDFATSPVLNVLELDGANGFRMNGEGENDFAGQGLSGVGDINNDGFDDIVVGAPRETVAGVGKTGVAYLVFGKPQFSAPAIELAELDGTNGIQINGAVSDDNFGFRAAPAGDFNHDGIDDFAVTALLDTVNGINAGAVHVIFGRSPFTTQTLEIASLETTAGVKIKGPSAASQFGKGLSSAGDMNGDGFDDLVIGAPYSNAFLGAAYVVFSKPTTSTTLEINDLDGSNGFVLIGDKIGDLTGRSVSGGGDVNGDGHPDIIIGARGADANGADSGAAYVAFGKSSFTTGTYSLSRAAGIDVLRLNGPAGSKTGTWVSNIGNFNNGSYADFVVGAHLANLDAGAAYTIFGAPLAVDPDPDPVQTLADPRLKVFLKFSKPGRDAISVKGVLPLADGFQPAGKEFVMNVGGAVRSFVMDDKGRAKTTTGSLKLKPLKRKKSDTTSTLKTSFAVLLRREDLAADLLDEGLENTTQKNKSVNINVGVTLDGIDYQKLVPQKYSAKQGKSGRTK